MFLFKIFKLIRSYRVSFSLNELEIMKKFIFKNWIIIIISLIGTLWGLIDSLNNDNLYLPLIGRDLLWWEYFLSTFLIVFVIFKFISWIIIREIKKRERKWDKKIRVEEEKLNNLKDKILKSNENKILDISEFKSILEKEENNINNKDTKVLHNFTRLLLFFENYEEQILSNSNVLSNLQGKKFDQLNRSYNQFTNLNSSLNKLYPLGLIMLKSYLDNKTVEYYKIYEFFDKLHVFDSTHQKKLIETIQKVSTNISNLTDEVKSLRKSVGYTNLLLTYNSIQLSSIQNNLKK